MFQLEIIDSNNLNEWYEYFDRLSLKGIYHDPKYVTCFSEHFGGDAQLCIFGNEDIFIYYPYYKRSLEHLPYADDLDFDVSGYFDIISSWYYGGPIVSDPNYHSVESIVNEFCKVFREYCRDNGIVSEFIRFDPIIKNYELFKCLNPQFDRETVYVDLTKREDEIWNEFEKRNRTSIRKAIKSGLSVRRGLNLRDLKNFAEIYLKEMDRKKAAKHYWFDFDFFKKIKETLENSFQVFLVEKDSDTIGGGIVARGYGVAHDFLRASLPEYWKFQPNNLLLFEEIKWCKKVGDTIFDLQGGRSGVFNFKKAFSPLRGKFYVSRIVHLRDVYKMLTEEAKKLGVGGDGFFPEYRVKE